MRNTFPRLWLIPASALCLMAASSAEEASDAKKPQPASSEDLLDKCIACLAILASVARIIEFDADARTHGTAVT